MGEPTPNEQIDSALRSGLRAVPTPEPGPDFDTRVLAALATTQPPWRPVWRHACACFAGMGVSCLCVLGIISLLQGPAEPRTTTAAPENVAASAQPIATASLDEVLAVPDLSAGTAAQWVATGVLPPVSTPEPPRRPRQGLPRRAAREMNLTVAADGRTAFQSHLLAA